MAMGSGGGSKRKVRNALVILILCMIGAYFVHVPAAPGRRPRPAEVLPHAVAGPSGPALRPFINADEQLRDALAAGPSAGVVHDLAPRGETEDRVPPPPRGIDHAGIGPLSEPNPASQLPRPAPLSPSGPAQPSN